MELENIIKDVQHLSRKIFNKEVAKMHYSKDRLNGFTMNQLLDLERWFKREILIKNEIKYNNYETTK
jgi:hypothetical protein|tara:strand:+ start:22 stop:222 length:201 start_codon:yes stop_codon:yes gene_type:complete